MRKRSDQQLDDDPDAYVLKLVGDRPNLLVPHFLMHSWLYYVKDAPLVSDQTFDQIVKGLELHWSEIHHVHKKLIDRELLKTGYYLQYPSIAIHSAVKLCELFGRAVRP